MDTLDAALRAVLMYAAVPLWAAAGFGDWLCHRRDRIEETAGWPEASLHILMLAVLGSASLAVLFLEIDAGVLVGLVVAWLVHELLVWCDLLYANRCRRIGAVEQWIHGVQFAMPLLLLIGVCLLHRDQLLSVFGLGSAMPDWRLRLKADPLSSAYTAVVLAGCAVTVVVPFGEECWRCVRSRRTGGVATSAPGCRSRIAGPASRNARDRSH